ncbi:MULTISPECIES: symmetrical bis(5'-nucleosyl)-tetraphosphatase [Acinetobacter]|jgi:bis(5'-nucleosyl)-tetraphosphatase (symmetrical)|uniref:bis(5'-nucleosyl)-tetraphosphatase (symmetrical) n=2 Tax=Acinetobacter johnsonii TaxID=40214 RepID=A0A239RQ47_ACIJO|nr:MULTISPECIES: symmetrical bis(5'-nucleosyl)-tetraphosphatase [Acinetobacter]ENU39693.1 bis(5'-nucleosyl)-tetraphosphatase (symmetrical) [Acinetobacter johnsonii CIP 64.6]ENV73234.1 bis(5'-nucleosyl)-tetraphosphatase (symmetrical) [Acinetobacter johnsonii ANC 3681]MBO7705804.1 symmetrical bis(5'-nucleosyl)-tetraphosphatase [Acinetobacter sp.]MCV2451475.1 symmetrical bis(5'-nucleosyl)-tetraphosphatase [Acinetobacter johnsonii]MDH1726204.1 symmetrical bis(5'-nucleosyl)-tetraphosphatase [Acinet
MAGAEIRYNYVIGDVQGCFEALKALLKTIQFDPDQDFIWFAGDLVARGENSLGALRFIKKLVERNAAATVLGNHDLTLLAAARGIKAIKDKDNIRDVIDAIDSDDLIDWLRKQPLCVFPNATTVLTHAGIPTNWTAEQTAALAAEVEAVIAADDFDVVDAFLKEMYGKEPTLWSDELTGHARLRCIVNYLTRMRLTDSAGRLEFSFKDSLNDPMPEGFKPWFEFASQAAQTHKVVFGHWAALQGKTISDSIQNVDGGCVWGHQLMAYRLEDETLFAVDNPVQ